LERVAPHRYWYQRRVSWAQLQQLQYPPPLPLNKIRIARLTWTCAIRRSVLVPDYAAPSRARMHVPMHMCMACQLARALASRLSRSLAAHAGSSGRARCPSRPASTRRTSR
jgi:hypothetical protein